MAQQAKNVIGIDLGTTFSVMSRVDDAGRPVTLRNAEGELLTPSVVLFDQQEVIVGREAVKALATEANKVAECAKRELGAGNFHKPLDGRRFPPEVIEAYILKKLVSDAEAQIGRIEQAVITVPAYFDDVRRKATQDAGYMAGLEVLDIINEPTAAALAFGHAQGVAATGRNRSQAEQASPERVLVYDLGGGTFDVTVMEIRGRDFNTLAIDGDVQLGGRDWDQRLVDFVAERFTKRYRFDPRAEPRAAARLAHECEEAKRTLSSRSSTTVVYDCQGSSVEVDVSRSTFLELTQDLLGRTEFTTQEVLRAAGMDWSQIDRVLLVGGATRMPMVVDMLRQLSGKEPQRSLAPDEAVAHGAALHAHWLTTAKRGKRPEFHIHNVNSHSLGVIAFDPHTRQQRNAVVIPRNTRIPVTARRVFRTRKPGQRSILVRIIEGESAAPEHCTRIGRCVVPDLPTDLPDKTPIEVLFHYRPDGRLTVLVRVAGTNRELQHELTRACGLTPSELYEWRRRIGGYVD